MYAEDTIPVRIPRRALRTLHKLKAKRMLSTGKKVSDALIIEEVVEFVSKNEGAFMKKPGTNWSKLAGIIKGGPKTNATEELDEVLYGGDPNE